MNLCLGITKELIHWNILLNQIGISYSEIDWGSNLLDEYAVIIVNSDLDEEEAKKILQFVDNGGSLLIEADFAKNILKINTRSIYIKYLFSDERVFGYNLPLIDLYRSCNVSVTANVLFNQKEQSVVSFFKQGKGNVIVIPDNFVSAVSDYSVLRKKIYSSVKEPPTERISKVSKGSLYHFIRAALEHLYHIRNLPFVSLWIFPGKVQNIFLFRIDTDYGSQEQVEQLYKTLRENRIKGTWFIETKSAEKQINKYSTFEEQELALHCYRHRIFNSYNKNYNNFKKGIEILNKASVFPKGIAAPFGEWNNSFNVVAEDLGFDYSSEFSYSYDNLPYFSIRNNKLSSILQIPVHPISFGRLFQAGYNDDQMYEYFINVINQKISLCEPVIIYTHPMEERYDVHKRIFNFANKMNLYKISFNEYSDWWKKRYKVLYKACLINNKLKIETDTNDESFRIRVTSPDKANYLIPLSGTDTKKTRLDIPQFKYDSNFQPNILRKYTKRMLKDDILFEVRKRKL